MLLLVCILLGILAISVNRARTTVEPLEVLETDLDGLHLLQKLLEGRRVQSRLKVHTFGNFSELWQVGVHEACAFVVFIILRVESDQTNIVF